MCIQRARAVSIQWDPSIYPQFFTPSDPASHPSHDVGQPLGGALTRVCKFNLSANWQNMMVFRLVREPWYAQITSHPDNFHDGNHGP